MATGRKRDSFDFGAWGIRTCLASLGLCCRLPRWELGPACPPGAPSFLTTHEAGVGGWELGRWWLEGRGEEKIQISHMTSSLCGGVCPPGRHTSLRRVPRWHRWWLGVLRRWPRGDHSLSGDVAPLQSAHSELTAVNPHLASPFHRCFFLLVSRLATPQTVGCPLGCPHVHLPPLGGGSQPSRGRQVAVMGWWEGSCPMPGKFNS